MLFIGSVIGGVGYSFTAEQTLFSGGAFVFTDNEGQALSASKAAVGYRDASGFKSRIISLSGLTLTAEAENSIMDDVLVNTDDYALGMKNISSTKIFQGFRSNYGMRMAITNESAGLITLGGSGVIASGTPSGAATILSNSRGLSIYAGNLQSFGITIGDGITNVLSPKQYEPNQVINPTVAMVDATTALVAYRDHTLGKLKCVVVSNLDLDPPTVNTVKLVADSAGTTFNQIIRIDATTFFLIFEDSFNNTKAVIITLNVDNTCNIGTPVTFRDGIEWDGSYQQYYCSMQTSTRFPVVYVRGSTGGLGLKMITRSGTTLTVSAEKTVKATGTNRSPKLAKYSSTKYGIFYDNLKGIVATLPAA